MSINYICDLCENTIEKYPTDTSGGNYISIPVQVHKGWVTINYYTDKQTHLCKDCIKSLSGSIHRQATELYKCGG